MSNHNVPDQISLKHTHAEFAMTPGAIIAKKKVITPIIVRCSTKPQVTGDLNPSQHMVIKVVNVMTIHQKNGRPAALVNDVKILILADLALGLIDPDDEHSGLIRGGRRLLHIM